MDSNKWNMEKRKVERRKLIMKFCICIFSFVLFAIVSLDHRSFKYTQSNRRVKREQKTDDKEDEIIKCENGGIWNKKLRSCACTLGWIGNKCNVWRRICKIISHGIHFSYQITRLLWQLYNHYCFFDNGLNYRGKLSLTKTGTICQPWTTDENLRFKLGELGIGVHNYCRNPDNDEKGLWCFVGGEQFVEYCNATRCPDSVKKLLSLNAGDIGPADDTSAAVQFLFGPLISGVCAGVVALLAFIAIAEYARRKKIFSRRRKPNNRDSTTEKNSMDIQNVDEEKGETSLECDRKSKTDIRTLGGIVTVDVDTGKEKVHTYTSKKMSKARLMLERAEYGEDNNAFIQAEVGEARNVSVESNDTGPPPPYQLVEDTQTSPELKEMTDISQGLDIDTNAMNEIEPRIYKDKQRPNKVKSKRRSTSRPSSKAMQNMIEKQTVDDSEISPVQSELPVPKPRVPRESNHQISDVRNERNRRKKITKTRENDDGTRGESKQKGRGRQCNFNDTIASNDETRQTLKESKSKSQLAANIRHSQRQRSLEEQINEIPPYRKRKSVKDLAKNFEEGFSNFRYEDDENVYTDFKYIEPITEVNENETIHPHSTLNSRMEPTTFL
ncbi:uncharacterized protein LOC120334435 isoform X1 [Styela clava]